MPPEIVYVPTNTIKREENNNQESQIRSSSKEVKNIQSLTNDYVDNPIDYNITQELNHDVKNNEAANVWSSQ